MAFSTKINGHHHLQDNVLVYNVRIPAQTNAIRIAQAEVVRGFFLFFFVCFLGFPLLVAFEGEPKESHHVWMAAQRETRTFVSILEDIREPKGRSPFLSG